MKTFIPFHELNDREAIIVDGAHVSGLVLSHWKGQNNIHEIEDDTSAAIVLNALKHHDKFQFERYRFVTATHFDIDGLIGIWAVDHVPCALQHEELLKAIGRIGDFREFRFYSETDRQALKIVCWIDEEEQQRFYPPFGEEQEMKACTDKFAWFLPRLEDVILNTEQYRSIWEAKYNRVMKEAEHAYSAGAKKYDDCGLTVFRAEEPLHYYAYFGLSEGTDIVLTMYKENRYELEYKYTTWVDIASRKVYPRISMQPLCDYLNSIEKSGLRWYCDSISDTGPILRLENSELAKAERFADPFKRKIYSSSIDPVTFESLIVSYFEFNFQKHPKRYKPTWHEMRSIQPAMNFSGNEPEQTP
ncbi:MAG: hypothetical protein Fur0041_18980 [Bacteroidia bacterium]